MEHIESQNTRKNKRQDAYFRAQKRLKEIKGFYWHFFWYLVVNIFLVIVISKNSNEEFWSFHTFSTAFFWGIGVAFHALGVFGRNHFFTKSWEDRKIREFMDKENNTN